MAVNSTIEICKVGRRLIAYERIYEPDPERCKAALRILLNSKPVVKNDENIETG